MHAKSLQSCPTLCDPWTVPNQATLSMGFSTQEYWSGLSFPPPKDLPDPRIKPACPDAPALQILYPSEPSGKPNIWLITYLCAETFLYFIGKVGIVILFTS